jgi:hypothetical protein
MNSNIQSEIKDSLGALRIHAHGITRPEAQAGQLKLLNELEKHIIIM